VSSPAAVRVTEQVRADIIFGRIAAGTRLTEKLLSERYAVSRVPVRECLRALEAEGLVEVRSYAGATVVAPHEEDLEVLFDLRHTLETEVVRRAALRAQEQLDLDVPGEEWWALRRAATAVLEEGDAALAAGEAARLPSCNHRFHLLLAEMSGATSLLGILRQVSGRIERLFSVAGTHRGGGAWDEHRAILAAVLDGRAEDAPALMAAHLERSRAGLRAAKVR
jgi:DNA-binding GntR family transcriptional regulator